MTNFKITKVKVRNADKPFDKLKIYIFTRGETILNNLENRRVRPYTLYKKEIIPQLIKQGVIKEGQKVRWSQNAGCSCGCSPGFIVDGEDAYGKEIFVDIKGVA